MSQTTWYDRFRKIDGATRDLAKQSSDVVGSLPQDRRCHPRAVEKGASVVLMPVSSRKQLFELSDDLATKVTIVFYNDAREALKKAIAE